MARRKPKGRMNPTPKTDEDLVDAFVQADRRTNEQQDIGTDEQVKTKPSQGKRIQVRYSISSEMDDAIARVHYKTRRAKSHIVEEAFWAWLKSQEGL